MGRIRMKQLGILDQGNVRTPVPLPFRGAAPGIALSKGYVGDLKDSAIDKTVKCRLGLGRRGSDSASKFCAYFIIRT